MNKICTSLEQSQRLIELGIDVNTADMHYSTWTILNKGEYILSPNQGETIEELQEDYGNQIIPVWSLSALMELIQDDIKIEKTLFDQSDMFTYSIIGDGYEYRSHEYECLLDAAFEFVCWILENKNQ